MMRSIALAALAALTVLCAFNAAGQGIPTGVRGSVPLCTKTELHAGTCQSELPGYLATITDGNAADADRCASGFTAGGSEQVTCRYKSGDWEEFEPGEGGGGSADLGTTVEPTQVTVTNTAGSNAVLPAATGSTAGVLEALDKLKIDTVYLARDVGGAAGLDQTDIEAAIQAACTTSGAQLAAECLTILVDGTVTLTDTVHVTGDGLAPSATTGEAAWTVRIVGTGPALFQLAAPPAAPTSRCSTLFQWEGASPAPMIQVHAGRRVELVDLCLNAVGTSSTATYGVAITASTDAGEVAKGIRIDGLDIYAFEDTWAEVLAQTPTIGIGLLPDSGVGSDPPYADQVQIDNLVVRNTVINAPRGFLGANGFTNGVRLENTHIRYTLYGAWVEESDLTITGGLFNNLAAAGQTGDQASVCDAAQAALLIGSTSDKQPSTVQWYEPNPEVDCGYAVDTVAATDPADTRDSALTMVGGRVAVGGNGQTTAFRYNHHGTVSILGTILGTRNAEAWEDGYMSLLPPSGGTLRAFIDSPTIGNDWDSGLFQVTRNDQVAPATGAPGTILANVLHDSNGDGVKDYVRVFNDFNRDGSTTPEDIDAAAKAVLAEAGASVPKFVVITGGPYSMDGVTFDWNTGTRYFIEHPNNTAISCEGGATIEGFGSMAQYNALAFGTSMIGDSTGPDSNLSLTGCNFVNPVFATPHDGSSLASVNHFGLHYNGTTDLTTSRNTVNGTRHTCFYARDTTRWKADGNTAKNCGGVLDHGGNTTTLASSAAAKALTITLAAGGAAATGAVVGDPIVMELDDGTLHHADIVAVATDVLTIRPVPRSAATAGNAVHVVDSGVKFDGFYSYAESSDSVDTTWRGNTVDGAGGRAFLARAASASVKIREIEIDGNSGSRTLGPGLSLQGVVRGHIVGNNFTLTKGMLLPDDGDGEGYCYSATPDADCVDDVTIARNAWNLNRYQPPGSLVGAITWGRGHSRIRFFDNLINRTIDGACMALYGNAPGSLIEGNTLRLCGGHGFIDGSTSFGAVTSPLEIRDLKIRGSGAADITGTTYKGIFLLAGHTALSFPGLSISGCTDECIGINGNFNSMSDLVFRDFELDGTTTGFLGRMTEAQANALLCDADLEQRWVMTTNASGDSDVDFSAGTGSTQNAAYCNGSAWVDLGAASPSHRGVDASSSTSQDRLAFINGVIRNMPANGRGMQLGGTGSYDRMVLHNLRFENDGQGVRDSDAMQFAIVANATTVTDASIRGVSCGAGVSTCVDNTLDDTEVSGDSDWQSTQTPDGACASGARHFDLNATENAEAVCVNGAWRTPVDTDNVGASCVIYRDSDDGGDTACSYLDGVASCEVDTNGVCGDAT